MVALRVSASQRDPCLTASLLSTAGAPDTPGPREERALLLKLLGTPAPHLIFQSLSLLLKWEHLPWAPGEFPVLVSWRDRWVWGALQPALLFPFSRGNQGRR